MIKKLARCIREYKLSTILAPIFIIGEVIMEVIIPLLMAQLIDKGIDGGSMPNIVKYGLILVVCAVISLAFGALSAWHASKASAGFAKNLRHDIYEKVQQFSFYNIDKFSASSLVTRLTTDVSNVQQSFMMIIRIALRGPMMLIFSLIAAFFINPKLSLIFLIAIPILGVALFYISKAVHPVFEKMFKTYDKLNENVQENVRGVRIVKTFVREDYEKNKFNSVSDRIFKLSVKAEHIMAFNSPIMMFVIDGTILLISWLGAKLIVMNGMTTGQLLSLITYAMQILSSLMMLMMVYVMMVMSITCAKRIVEVLDEVPELADPAEPITELEDGSIEFKNASFSYLHDMDKLCIKHLNLSIKSGETIGILGGTGSGKSTMVSLIPRLYDVSEGEVLVGGHNVKDYSLKSLRDGVAMVLQKNVLFSGSIKENMRWGNAQATDEEIVEACKAACADEFISKFPEGYDTWIEQGGSNVSGGQKQRLCIARALLKKPAVLVLDDSTSAVDTATDAKIRRAFKEICPGTTKLIIAQRVASVQDADRIVIINEGEICGVGTHDELLKDNTIYQEVYYSQMKGGDFDEAK